MASAAILVQPSSVDLGRSADRPLMRRIERALVALRSRGRRAVSIVDLGCGEGMLAIAAARRARALGFLAISVHGYDRSAERVRAARRAARFARDPAIGFDFAPHAPGDAVPLEDQEADLTLAAPGEAPATEIERITVPGGAVVNHG